jgi:hypothetical protein
MATPIIPKSEARINNNIMVGFGEVPYVEVDGKPGWGLPNGEVVHDVEEALAYAEALDKMIRSNKNFNPKRLVH